MLTEKSTLKTEAVFSKNKLYRYLLRKEWNNKKKKAMVIMINPSSADTLTLDYTTLYTLNNLQTLNFGSVDIVNLFPLITDKLDLNAVPQNEILFNNNFILNLAENVDSIILAWGKKGENNKKIFNAQQELINLLKKYLEKIFILGDENGNFWFHPLAPQVRFKWNLSNFKNFML